MKCVAFWLLVLALAAQPADPGELAAMQRRAADATLSPREREQAADRAIEARRALIKAARDDEPRLVGWLIDQAAAVLARLGRDGADSAAIFGIPLSGQRDAARQAGEEAQADLTRAAALIEAAARTIPAEDPQGAALEQDRTVRIPFYRARAGVILAGLAQGAERARLAQAAYAAIAKLPLANAGPEASRRVCLAAALLMRASPPTEADARTAVEELAWVVRAGSEVPPVTRGEAWMGMAHAGVRADRVDATLQSLTLALGQDPFIRDGRSDPLLIVLAADAQTRALWERGVESHQEELLLRAAAAQTALLTRPDLGLRPETLRPIVLEKLSLLGAPAEAEKALPPAVRLGRAIALAREGGRREEAMAQFRALAESGGEFKGDALWECAVLLTQAAKTEERLEAARVLTRLAREVPEYPRASEAIAAALAHARSLAVQPEAGRPATDAYAEALAVATDSYPNLPEIDLWRYERARLLVQQGGDLRLARGLLESVGAGAAVFADAVGLLQRVHSSILDGNAAALAVLRRQGDEAALKALATERAVPDAKRAFDWAVASAPPAAPRFRLDLAEATLEAGQDSAAAYQQLLPQAASLPGGLARVQLGLARALLRRGDSAGAFTHLRELATRLDAAGSRSEAFWHAWALMLQTSLDQDSAGAKRGSIRASIKRLEGIDPELGGEPWKSRIDKVRRAVAE